MRLIVCFFVLMAVLVLSGQADAIMARPKPRNPENTAYNYCITIVWYSLPLIAKFFSLKAGMWRRRELPRNFNAVFWLTNLFLYSVILLMLRAVDVLHYGRIEYDGLAIVIAISLVILLMISAIEWLVYRITFKSPEEYFKRYQFVIGANVVCWLAGLFLTVIFPAPYVSDGWYVKVLPFIEVFDDFILELRSLFA